MNNKEKFTRDNFKEELLKLDKRQMKLFYSILTHSWAVKKALISTQKFFNLWWELNTYCYKTDKSFPNPYEEREKLKKYCQTYPYYFIDILDIGVVKKLFCEHFDDQFDILTMIVRKLYMEDLRAAYEYANDALNMDENIDELVTETENYVDFLSK